MDPHREHFEYLALEWDSFQPPDRDNILNRLLASFDGLLKDSERILDVGTGTGAIIPILRSRYPAAKIISVDLALEMLICSRRRVTDSLLIQADVHRMPFVDRSFSAIICHNSFPHFMMKTLALLELKRLLQSRGNLLIMHDGSREKINKIHQHAEAEILHRDLLPDGITLGQMLESAGFVPDHIEDTDKQYVVTAFLR